MCVCVCRVSFPGKKQGRRNHLLNSGETKPVIQFAERTQAENKILLELNAAHSAAHDEAPLLFDSFDTNDLTDQMN